MIKTGNDEEAKKHFEIILEKEPGYIGSYYHLGKLLERQGDEASAIKIYELGMEMSRNAGNHHALSELRSAYEELTM
jgi:tetratricopeptide (TPR) repeat protein